MKKTIIAFFVLSLFLSANAENLYACSRVLSKESVKKQVKTDYQGSTAIAVGALSKNIRW